MRLDRRLTATFILLLELVMPPAPGNADTAPKKLIQFGWGEPDAEYMRKNAPEMEKLPLDGVVFRITARHGDFLREAWGNHRFKDDDIAPAIRALRNAKFNRFTDNFFNVDLLPGDVDWFDDFQIVLSNLRLASRVAKEGNAKGIFLDLEPYQYPLFNYTKQKYSAHRSWADYCAQAKRRGIEVMSALQSAYPDMTLFLSFGLSMPYLDVHGDRSRLAADEYGLLVPFLDGLTSAAGPAVTIVDGYESSYLAEELRHFIQGMFVIKVAAPQLLDDPAQYRKKITAGFGLWLDAPAANKEPWSAERILNNRFTPAALSRALTAALTSSDRYVWIYSQQPRFWSAGGRPSGLPQAYIDAIFEAKQRVVQSAP